jgi:drug/metabolite transporter (DMT)-like permease
LIGKKLLNKKVGVNLILAGRQFFGGMMLLLFTFVTNKNFISLFSYQSVSIGFFLGMIAAIVALCWYMSIKKISVSVASSFLPLTALVSLFASVVYLKEVVSIQQYIGFLLIVSGMFWQTHIINNKA